MFTSPKYYPASHPSSRSASRHDDRPASPQTKAQVRSEAIAKLKRAASLPRNADGRRPIQRHAGARTDDSSGDAEGSPGILPISVEISSLSRPDAPPRPTNDEQEMLSPSPVQITFDHASIHPSVDHMHMQRSASASPSHNMTCNDYPSPTNGVNSERHAMQLAQPYLPSLAPRSINSLQQQVPLAGRDTPSPLPTLGELRTLQRSNSQAARAQAMSKLTGGKGATMNDDVSLHLPLRSLQRAGTLGANTNRTLRTPSRRRAEFSKPVAQDGHQATAFDEPRPRLQRSFTVSSSNMGEERRSAVGRRMVERLAERRAARQKEEEEVRRLWEERKAATDPIGKGQAHDIGRPGTDEQEQFQVTSSVSKTYDDGGVQIQAPTVASSNLLSAPERPVSGVTMQSAQFEYEDHLRRSLSSRTARGAVGVISEPVPPMTVPSVQSEATEEDTEQLNTPTLPQNPMNHHPKSQASGASVPDLDAPLLPPHPPFITPTRHIAHDSTSTIQGSSNSPGGSSTPGGSSILSGLDSMMFVTGGTGGHYAQLTSQGEVNWPVEAAEGSDWGTPGKEMHQTTLISSPTSSARIDRPRSSTSEIFSTQVSETGGAESDYRSPNSHNSYGMPSTGSAMSSWEEVGRTDDQVSKAPANHSNHARSESVGAKMKRTMKSAMRKHSQSRSSMTSSSPPVSPRRGSGASAAPSQGSVPRIWPKGEPLASNRIANHHPSVSSLSVSQANSATASSSNLIQHQLSSGPSQVSLLPRANLNDPRIHISKLSPFPGIEHLESRSAGLEESPGEKPKLMQQVSDSVIPSHSSVLTPGGTPAPENIYALPLVARAEANKRLSGESVTKRNWLTKALTSPRSSLSRKISYGDVRNRGNPLGQGAMVISSGVDPFASPPMGAVPTSSTPSIPSSMSPGGKSNAASPTVSTVPEMNEDRTRAATLVRLREGESAPGMIQERVQMRKEALLPKKTIDILRRMDEVLALGPEHPARPEMLDDPPRKFLMSSQILQVVNADIVKDRFLFLFTDLLVIAKPILVHNIHATLDTQFTVKNIVSLDKLLVTAPNGESPAESGRHPVVDQFVDKFKQDPVEACRYVVEKCSPAVDLATLAGLILRTSELDKTQVGLLLGNNEGLTRAFVDRFHFRNIRVDDALRMFLLSLRLPTDHISCETLLKVFAERYYVANHDHLTYNQELAIELVLTIMKFNDALYSTFGFASANNVITREAFITAFRSKDPHGLVPHDLLSQIYTSLRSMRLTQALASNEVRFERWAVITLPHTSTKLTYNVWSEKIYINIPAPDTKLRIKLLGEGLEFDPPELDFANKTEESFKLKGTSLGMKTLLLVRVGDNAALYGSLGSTRQFTVERAFMRHTFQIAFSNHRGLKREYCFSTNSSASCQKWRELLEKHIKETKRAKSMKGSSSRDVVRQTAEAVSFQVLRDALICSEETAQPTQKNAALRLGGNATALSEQDVESRSRTGSISAAYAQFALKEEYELGPLQRTRGEKDMDKASEKVNTRTGKELVLLCRQNSLMPGLLKLLHAGAEHGPDDGQAREGVGRDENVVRSKGKRV